MENKPLRNFLIGVGSSIVYLFLAIALLYFISYINMYGNKASIHFQDFFPNNLLL